MIVKCKHFENLYDKHTSFYPLKSGYTEGLPEKNRILEEKFKIIRENTRHFKAVNFN